MIRLVIRLVHSRGNLHSLLDPCLFDCWEGDLTPKLDGWRQFRDRDDGPACCMLAPQPWQRLCAFDDRILMPRLEPKGCLSLPKTTRQMVLTQTSLLTKQVNLTMAWTFVLRTSVQMKDVIKKFLETVCGFMADAAKEITKNQGYDDRDKFYRLDDKGVDILCSIVRKPHALASRSTSGHAISNLEQKRPKLAILASSACLAKLALKRWPRKTSLHLASSARWSYPLTA